VIESTLYMLWDLKLKVGHASRTVDDCLRLARDDFTIRTALLEHRYLCGDRRWPGSSRTGSGPSCSPTTRAEFIEAKLAERAERHAKQGGQRYMLEPNVKEGKGGLRDLQTLYWIAKYIHRVDQAAELVEHWASFRRGIPDLPRRRDLPLGGALPLHHITGRATDQLTFDLQVEVAERMGYSDQGGRRGGRAFHAGLFPPRHQRGRADPHLPDRAGGAPRQARARPLCACCAARRRCAGLGRPQPPQRRRPAASSPIR
jgi:[protein-PII] uridylyltransferase